MPSMLIRSTENSAHRHFHDVSVNSLQLGDGQVSALIHCTFMHNKVILMAFGSGMTYMSHAQNERQHKNQHNRHKIENIIK
jgi:hypothetical protein